MLWVIAQAEKEIASEGGVSGIFQIDLGDGRFWIGAISKSVPLPFESSDALFIEDQLQAEIADIQEQALEIAGDMDVYKLQANEFLRQSRNETLAESRKGGHPYSLRLLNWPALSSCLGLPAG